jgi:16S rRNA processing protein RimM
MTSSPQSPMCDLEEKIVVGRISGVYGIKGWVRILSFTSPLENILSYRPWRLTRESLPEGFGDEIEFAEGRRQGKGLVARLPGIDDRDAAAKLVGAEIEVARGQFAVSADGEFYWADLIGLHVETSAGEDLGVVESLLETGANDVLVIAGTRRRLIPYLKDEVIVEVDLDQQKIVVDWDPEF